VEQALNCGRLSLVFWLQQYDLDGLRERIIVRIDANGQTAFGQAGLEVPRAHLHHIKRRLWRAPVDFGQGIRLLQEFQHFNLGSHTLSTEIMFAVNMPLKKGGADVLEGKFGGRNPVGTVLHFRGGMTHVGRIISECALRGPVFGVSVELEQFT
jgi:hypothetical protein